MRNPVRDPDHCDKVGFGRPLLLLAAFIVVFVALFATWNSCKAQEGDPAAAVELISVKDGFYKTDDWRFVTVKVNCIVPEQRRIVLIYESYVGYPFFCPYWYESATFITATVGDNGDDRLLQFSTPALTYGSAGVYLLDTTTGQPTTEVVYFTPMTR